MNKEELRSVAAQADISPMFLGYILARKRRPSPEVARRLERITGKHRLWWLYPDEFDLEGCELEATTPDRRSCPDRRQGERRASGRCDAGRRERDRRGGHDKDES